MQSNILMGGRECIHITFTTVCYAYSVLLLVIVTLCLTDKLNFITGMCV